jgi:hypothetical protein
VGAGEAVGPAAGKGNSGPGEKGDKVAVGVTEEPTESYGEPGTMGPAPDMVKSPSERVAAATGGKSKNMPDMARLVVVLVGPEVLEEEATGKAACIICRVKT